MKVHSYALLGVFIVSFALVPACDGTSTGNPMSSGGSGNIGSGAKFLKSPVTREAAPELSEEDAAALGAGNREFAFGLYRRLATPNQNLFFSPFSVSVAMAMTYPGAASDTKTEIASALHFTLPEPALHSAFDATLRALQGRSSELPKDTSGTGFQLSIVNQAWGQKSYPFLDGYLDVLARYYDAGLFAVDFGDSEPTRLLINGWVAEQTATRIPELLPADSLSSDTRLVLTNAIYFKASWRQKFDPKNTQDAPFHAPAADRVIPMMNQTLETPYAKTDAYEAVDLPYLSEAVRMLLVLPSTNLASLGESLDDEFFQGVRGELSDYRVTLGLPKFEFESKNPLKAPLSELGMPGAFTSSADFSGLAGGVEPLYIDEVYHDAFVAVDEQGTEAAAATAVVIGRTAVTPSASITFDRPFLFAIYDAPSGQILFLGHLADPG